MVRAEVVLTQASRAVTPWYDFGTTISAGTCRVLLTQATPALIPWSDFFQATTSSSRSRCPQAKNRLRERKGKKSSVLLRSQDTWQICSRPIPKSTVQILETTFSASSSRSDAAMRRIVEARMPIKKTLALNAASQSTMQQGADVDANAGTQDKMLLLPKKHIVVGCGAAAIDYLASVAEYPQPDDKIRTEAFVTQGGGNAGNALTAAARLGLKPRLFTKVADDSTGRFILDELEEDGVDTKNVVVSKGGVSPFTYIIVDKKTKTRTCIHTPGTPGMRPEELSDEAIQNLLGDASIVYFDMRLWETAIKLAKEAKARGLPILVDAEKPRDGLDELLSFANYVVAASKFPQVWTGASTLADALLQMMIKLPDLQFVIATLGADGCVMLRRDPDDNNSVSGTMASDTPDLDVGKTLEELKDLAQQRRVTQSSEPVIVSSKVGRLMLSSPHLSETLMESTGVLGTMTYGTAKTMLPQEIVDTTGAGDAFIGAVLYALCEGMPPSRMLALAASVAAAKCQALGARAGLPYREDNRVASLL